MHLSLHSGNLGEAEADEPPHPTLQHSTDITVPGHTCHGGTGRVRKLNLRFSSLFRIGRFSQSHEITSKPSSTVGRLANAWLLNKGRNRALATPGGESLAEAAPDHENKHFAR